jgi:hypothetical protein
MLADIKGTEIQDIGDGILQLAFFFGATSNLRFLSYELSMLGIF